MAFSKKPKIYNFDYIKDTAVLEKWHTIPNQVGWINTINYYFLAITIDKDGNRVIRDRRYQYSMVVGTKEGIERYPLDHAYQEAWNGLANELNSGYITHYSYRINYPDDVDIEKWEETEEYQKELTKYFNSGYDEEIISIAPMFYYGKT